MTRGESRVPGAGKRDRRRDREVEAEIRNLYAAHGPELFGMALRSIGNRELAEEIVQETFVRAWRARERFDPSVASRRTWMFSIARNLVIDAVRARRSRPVVSESVLEDRLPESDHSDSLLREMQVREALERLSPEHRCVVREVHLRGRSYADLAAELDVPEGTLRSRMYYALRSLRLVMEEMGFTR